MTLAGLNLGQKSIEALGAGYLLWKTACMVLAGTMTVGELITINALLLQLMAPLDHLGANYMQLNQGLVDAREMFTILKSNPVQQPPPAPAASSTTAAPANRQEARKGEAERQLAIAPGQLAIAPGHAVGITFRDVHFSYAPGSAAVERAGAGAVLKGLDLVVAPGSTVAIVGESGCGKSTLTRLLTRALTPTSGEVLLQGQDVGGLSEASVRQAVALVPQDASLFNEDVAYNIAYGSPEATPEQVRASAPLP